MRLSTPLSLSLPLCLAAAAVSASAWVIGPAAPAAAVVDPPPACTGGDPRAFPLSARIRGGPPSYEAGGGYGTWYIDLTNTTRRTCTGIHPVVVLVDDKHALEPDQPQLEFYDGPTARPVTFETTDEQELVGVLDGAGFDGFAVPAGRTVSVKVRLVFPSDTASDQVTVNAAVVQRRGDDGDWVGESNAYRFGIGEYASPAPDPTQDGGVAPSAAGSPQPTPGTGAGAGTSTATAGTGAGTPTPGPGTATPGPDADPDLPFPAGAEEAGERASELASTGPGLAHGLLAAATALAGVAGGALLLARRRR
ncbi:hypothetical protein SRB17_01820 [Streptomyces sp. RB17]|uniref:hypothetical protein n=1 Tax=Streptomyces sp. RB17 TaxID=2585197 RepID=UPI001294DC2C|nr:hypothetical protein [Streptomyces sp. RB17]MQY32239.1 hypothetical protein [Streptomyces sp. RB17]